MAQLYANALVPMLAEKLPPGTEIEATERVEGGAVHVDVTVRFPSTGLSTELHLRAHDD